MSDAMPKEQSEFINELSIEIEERTNYGSKRAREFAFQIWQNRIFLKEFLNEKNKGSIEKTRCIQNANNARIEHIKNIVSRRTPKGE